MKTSIGEIRRRDLTKAAYQVLLEHGLENTTVARIGAKAGMSHGIVNYYFKNKDALLNAVMRYSNNLIGENVARLMSQANTPREKLAAVVNGNFTEDVFKQENARAWLSLYAQSHKSSGFTRLQNLYYSRTRSNLVHYLKQLMPWEQAEETARGVSVLIDGLWLQLAMDEQLANCDSAIAMIHDYLERNIEKFGAP